MHPECCIDLHVDVWINVVLEMYMFCAYGQKRVYARVALYVKKLVNLIFIVEGFDLNLYLMLSSD